MTGEAQQKWASGSFKPNQRKDQRPHAPCPTCYADTTTDSTDQLITYTCPNGHAFIQTRPASIQHATWLARLTFTSETQNSRQT